MRPGGAHRLGSIIPDVLKQVEIRHGTLLAIQQEWSALVGKSLASHTKPVSLRRGRLVIHANRPGDSFALSYLRPKLLERLRARTEGKVEEMIVRPGTV